MKKAAKKPRRPAKKKALPGMTIVWLRWKDAAYHSSELLADDLNQLVTLESAGLLMKETPEAVSIATDYNPDTREWKHISDVPRVCILKMKRFQL